MKTSWSENELDNSLFAELISNAPSETKIRELVLKGANINAVSVYGEDVLIHAIGCVISPDVVEYWGQGLDIHFIQLLIELGANVNYIDDDNCNCLWSAMHVWIPELLEMLLKAGANPNLISQGENMTILDWLSADQHYEEANMNRGGAEPLAKMVALLKQYGAKYTSEITQ